MSIMWSDITIHDFLLIDTEAKYKSAIGVYFQALKMGIDHDKDSRTLLARFRLCTASHLWKISIASKMHRLA